MASGKPGVFPEVEGGGGRPADADGVDPEHDLRGVRPNPSLRARGLSEGVSGGWDVLFS